MSALRLSSGALEQIKAHAQGGYPYEVCGLLLGQRQEGDAIVLEVRPAANLDTQRAKDRYQLDPRDELAAQKDCRAKGWDILGYYHSHPDHPSRPSATDSELSWEGVVYMIASVSAQGVSSVQAWMRPVGVDVFEEVGIVQG